jgi:hypothetical protein
MRLNPGRNLIMRSRTSLAFLTLALLAGVSAARAGDSDPNEHLTEADRIVAIAQADNQVMEHLDHLTNKIGPRLTSSSNLAKAYTWAQGEFERFGLKNVHTEVWGEFPVGFDRGPSTGKLITDAGEKTLTFGTMAWSPGTKGAVRGPVLLEPKTKEEVESVKDQLKGAWLFQKGTRASKEIRKACDDAGIAGRVRSVGGELIVTDGNYRISWDKLPTAVQVQVTKSSAKDIATALEAKGKCELEFDIQNTFVKGPIQNKNVIADIVGTEHPDEFVIVGGHMDSWDGATGATDNGTGVATTLEAARLLVKAGVKPKRTIRFILWSGEEQGLFGSASYVKTHKDELPKVSCILIHDGGTNYVSGLGVTKAMEPLVAEGFNNLKGVDPKMPFKLKTVKNLPFGVGSDHDSFLAKGVPGFFWSQAGKQDYEHEHHTQYDRFEVAVPEYQKQSAVVIAQGALIMANLEQLLPRDGMLPEMAQGMRQRGGKFLGVQTDDEVVIQHVVEGSLAEKGGLLEGDQILSIAGTAVKSVEELRAAIRAAEGEIEVRFKRDGVEKSIKVVFEKKKPAEQQKKRWF